ncbi:MAG: PQQ-binding-like beta-propeller repeat protein, partial [Planctomycetaceae bacterium]
DQRYDRLDRHVSMSNRSESHKRERNVMNRIACACVLVLCSYSHNAQADNWPAWRGTAGDGVSHETNLPVKFGPNENVTWKSPLPGEGNSTPIVWDDRVFVTCPIDGGAIRSLICFDRNTGEELWRYSVPFPEKETTHGDNPFCSGSPTTDGELVYASFDSAGVVACDFAGKLVWKRDLGKLAHVFGTAITPVLYRDLLILHRGPGAPTHIVGLNKKTGETVWDTPEEGKNDPLWGSWSTPVFYRVDDRDEFALSMPNVLKGYDPLTGKELWRCDGLGPSNYPDTAVGDGMLIGVSGFLKSMFAVRLGGKGDVTNTHRLWFVEKTQQRVGSGVVYNGHLYVANAPGIAECIDVKTGETVWKERLGGDLWGSMLRAGDHLYVGNQQGEIFVMAAKPKYELIAKNEMSEHTKANIAPSDGQLFIRTYQNLYCIGERK